MKIKLLLKTIRTFKFHSFKRSRDRRIWFIGFYWDKEPTMWGNMDKAYFDFMDEPIPKEEQLLSICFCFVPTFIGIIRFTYEPKTRHN